jgi:hypothetical protein
MSKAIVEALAKAKTEKEVRAALKGHEDRKLADIAKDYYKEVGKVPKKKTTR